MCRRFRLLTFEHHRLAAKIQIEAVEVVLSNRLGDHRSPILAYLGNGKVVGKPAECVAVEQPLGMLPPPRCEIHVVCPVGKP